METETGAGAGGGRREAGGGRGSPRAGWLELALALLRGARADGREASEPGVESRRGLLLLHGHCSSAGSAAAGSIR